MGTVHTIPTALTVYSLHTQSLAYVMRWLETDEPETDLIRVWVAEAANNGLLEGDSRTGFKVSDIGRRWLEERGL